ncbi:PIN domain-containing protein [Rivularia sp. UHCC 0363]|uniref:PIN domain-containing protein n=1 Tax=Rivularia sp. UHCC 0363 TaxID=3110244 RepID=UPI002B1FAEDC|nr:PIN domain-containing protein [Rivularia sp. UHCC 0363]MEA5594683.1 PIN domain-containing protein [Rivularia sp. UHCC 0363]
MFPVVLDACVLFPMYLRDTLLSTADLGLYMPFWSQRILDEAMRNLVQKGKITAEKATNLERVMKAAFVESMVEVPGELEEVMTNHPKDRHVLATAVMAKANTIVTNNLIDFNAEALNPWNVIALSPDEFLSQLFDVYPLEMVQVVQKQSRRYKKRPLSVDDLLDLLSKKDGANLVNFVIKVSSCF